MDKTENYRVPSRFPNRNQRRRMLERLDPLEMPNYTLAEAVRYFHVPFSTVRYWTAKPHALVDHDSDRC